MLPRHQFFLNGNGRDRICKHLGIKTNVDLLTLVHKMEQDKRKDHKSKSNDFKNFEVQKSSCSEKKNQEFVIDLHLKSENMVIFHTKNYYCLFNISRKNTS